MMADSGFSALAAPETGPTEETTDAYRDLPALLPDEPSFSRILRKYMSEAQGSVVSTEQRDSKKALRNAARKARKAKKGALALAISIRAA